MALPWPPVEQCKESWSALRCALYLTHKSNFIKLFHLCNIAETRLQNMHKNYSIHVIHCIMSSLCYYSSLLSSYANMSLIALQLIQRAATNALTRSGEIIVYHSFIVLCHRQCCCDTVYCRINCTLILC